jgi:hypothetical protein
VEYFKAQNFWPLLWGAFFLINKFKLHLDAMSQRTFYALLVSISLVVYGIRGAGFRRELWGDDLELFTHANNRPTPTSAMGKIDYFGLFDPYNNYLIVWIRAMTHLAKFGPDSQFTWNVYVVMTVVYAVVISYMCFAISTYASRGTALLALGSCVFLPFSNLVILAQINTVIWPCALLMIVMSAIREYPKSKFGMTLLAIIFVITSISTLTVSIALVILVLNLAQDLKRINKYELVLFCLTSFSFVVQWSVYKPRTNPKLPLIGELHKALYNFAPQYIREKIGASLNGDDQIIFWIIPLMLLIIWLTQVNFARQTNWSAAISAAKLFVGGVVLLGLLIRGNGWFNTHYLFIPAAMFWVSLTLLFHQNRHEASTRMAVFITVGLFATTYSGTYYLL